MSIQSPEITRTEEEFRGQPETSVMSHGGHCPLLWWHLDKLPHAGLGPGDLMPKVPDLPDQKKAEDEQVAAAPRVPATVILREQAPHWLPLRALEWPHHSTGAQDGQQHDTA